MVPGCLNANCLLLLIYIFCQPWCVLVSTEGKLPAQWPGVERNSAVKFRVSNGSATSVARVPSRSLGDSALELPSNEAEVLKHHEKAQHGKADEEEDGVNEEQGDEQEIEALEGHEQDDGEEENEENEEEEEEGEEEEEEEPTPTDYAISLLLLGCVTFVMFLFIAANLEDEDMRLYVWRVINSTISIFVAVLGFSSINVLVHEHLLHGRPRTVQLMANAVQFLLYMMWMQYTIAYCSGALQLKPSSSHGTHDHMYSNADMAFAAAESPRQRIRTSRFQAIRSSHFHLHENQKFDTQLGMKCWATLMSHVTGFSAIALGGTIQREPLFAHSPLSSFLVIPMMSFGLWVIIALCRLARSNIHLTVRGEDNDKNTNARAWVTEVWEEEVSDAENEVSALCISFLTVQALRYGITDILPNPMGFEEEGDTRHNSASISKLFGITLGFVVLTGAMVVCVTKTYPAGVSTDIAALSQGFSFRLLLQGFLKRNAAIYTQVVAMCSAWCFLFGMQWDFARWFPDLGNPETITFRLVLALGVSGIGFCVTLVLDKVADATCVADEKIEDMLDLAVVKIISALSISVGFSWEQAFDGGVEVVAELMPCPPFVKDRIVLQIALSMAIVGLVTYAWRRYILVKVCSLEERREAKKLNVNDRRISSHPLVMVAGETLREDIFREETTTTTISASNKLLS